ncbi:unnamed protein product, partial [Didymodactylos carnosus]
AIEFYEEKVKNENDPLTSAQSYVNIGHWHLLLNDYSKALSAYQAAYALRTKLNQSPELLFGLGIVYAYFGSNNQYVYSLYVSF